LGRDFESAIAGVKQSGKITGHEAVFPVTDDKARPAAVGNNRRDSGSERLEHDVSMNVGPRREDERISLPAASCQPS